MPNSNQNVAITYGAFNLLSLAAIGLAVMAIATLLSSNLLASLNIELMVLLQSGLYLLVGLRFMSWLYGFIEAAQKNSESADGINPRLAYLGFGAPWLNLFLPYRIVVKLLNSFGDMGDSGGRLNTQTIAATWWALHITYFLLAPISFLLLHYQDLVDVIDLLYWHKVTLFVLNCLLVLGVSRCAHMLVSNLERGLQRQPR